MGKVGTHRGSIAVEDSVVISQTEYAADQFVLRVSAPAIAGRAEPGSFAHITCDPAVPMRRPLSIMRADADAGWIEFLYKFVGEGLRHLATRRTGDTISVIGPIGQPFVLHPERPRPLLIGGGVGIPPMVFVSDRMRTDDRARWQPLVLMGSEVPFPFTPKPSQILTPGVPAGVIACMPLLEDWGIPSRLASLQDFAGCFHGFITDLASEWLRSLDPAELAEVEILACGPTPMLEATAAVAREFDLPCQVSLEEYMACAVGGCAGCAVPVNTPDGLAMKRVCVDGPVFDASSVFRP
jgi:dihydroorotate dehydrogenase electron transfer subunit